MFFSNISDTKSGPVKARYSNVTLEKGTYMLHVVIIGSTATIMSPNPFVFVVE